MANIYDAGDYEINMLQRMLAANGISKDQLDLCNYAGLTYIELSGIVHETIANKKRREALANGRQSSDTSESSERPADEAEGSGYSL